MAARNIAGRPGLDGNVVDYLFREGLKPETLDRVLLHGDDRDVTYREIHARTCQAGNYLAALGLAPGDRMLMSVMDGPEFVALFLGAIKAGIVPLPINTYLRPRDYLYYLNDSGAKACLVDVSLVKAIDEIRRHLNSVRVFGVLGGAAAGYERVEAGLDAAATERETLPRAPDDMAFWLYSSGSTGDPKGVVHTHDHLYWAAELCGLNGYGFRRDDVIGCPPKMFFAMGLGGQVYFPMRVGAATLVSATPITPKRVWQQWIKHRPTIAMAVPTLLAGMLQVAEKEIGREAARRACERLRFVNSAGEILPPALMQRWKDYTGSEVLDGVGTTEMTHLFVINRPGRAVPGSCGRIVEGFRHAILDDARQPVPRGEIGNLWVYGPTAAREYWNKPEKTRETMAEGGVRTGDKVYEDEDGNLFMVGRSDDMLRVGAIWVSPAEVEGALVSHKAVSEAAVIGAPDAEGLVKPKAYVVLGDPAAHPDKAALEAALKAHVRAQLPGIKVPRWIEFVTELPKTATGKIQRFRLRQGP